LLQKFLALLGYLLLGVLLSEASIATATGVVAGVPAAAAVPAVVPVATSHQFFARSWDRLPVVPVTSPTYPNPYYKYSGGYPLYNSYNYPHGSYPYYQYAYPYTYQYASYPNYGYGYKSVW
ncbi:hypothetical protein KR018_002572, partial [Drosophila ironensis]